MSSAPSQAWPIWISGRVRSARTREFGEAAAVKKIDIGFVALSIVLSFPAAALAQNSTPPQAPAKAPAAKIPAIPPPPGIPPAGQKPTIAPQDKVTFTVGKLSSFMVKATGVPAPTLTQTGLPTDLGLSFDSKTGILQGSATKAIIAIITIQAKNKSGAVSKSFTLTVTDPPPCDGDTYTVRLRALQGADADGLAAALNGTFDEFSAVSATAPASSAGSNGSQNPSAAGASGQGQSQQNSSPPKQFLCVYKRETDAKTGKLTALVPVLPLPGGPVQSPGCNSETRPPRVCGSRAGRTLFGAFCEHYLALVLSQRIASTRARAGIEPRRCNREIPDHSSGRNGLAACNQGWQRFGVAGGQSKARSTGA